MDDRNKKFRDARDYKERFNLIVDNETYAIIRRECLDVNKSRVVCKEYTDFQDKESKKYNKSRENGKYYVTDLKKESKICDRTIKTILGLRALSLIFADITKFVKKDKDSLVISLNAMQLYIIKSSIIAEIETIGDKGIELENIIYHNKHKSGGAAQDAVINAQAEIEVISSRVGKLEEIVANIDSVVGIYNINRVGKIFNTRDIAGVLDAMEYGL